MDERITSAIATTMGHFNTALAATPDALAAAGFYLQCVAIGNIILGLTAIAVVVALLPKTARFFMKKATGVDDVLEGDFPRKSNPDYDPAAIPKMIFSGVAMIFMVIFFIVGVTAVSPTNLSASMSPQSALAGYALEAVAKRR